MAARPVTDPLRREAWRIARLRQGAHPDDGQLMSRKSGLEVNAVGVMGELVFARAYGLEVDERQRPYGDGGVDFWVPIFGRTHSLTIDVKTNTFGGEPCLLIPQRVLSKGGAEIYVLMQYSNACINFVGWETNNVMQCAEIVDLGYGPSYSRHCSDLRPMSQLASVLARRAVVTAEETEWQ